MYKEPPFPSDIFERSEAFYSTRKGREAMGKVVVFSYPYFGHVNPTIGLVRELAARGEEVYYYTIEPYMKYISMKGVFCRSYGDVLEELEEEITITTTEPLDVLRHIVPHKLDKHKRMSNLLIERVMADDPDYIIRDCEAYWGKMLGTILDVPVICYITTIALSEAMMDQQPEFFLKNVLGSRTDSFTPVTSGLRFSEYLNQYTRELSQPYKIDFKAIDAFSGADDLNLVFTTPEFQPFGEYFGPDYVFIGPVIRTDEDEEDEGLAQVAGSYTLIYISMGTVYNECLSFYKKCIEAFRTSNYRIIMSIGMRIHPDELGDLPAHFTVQPRVAQNRILRQADVFITHGGHNSVNEALYHHVPMVLFPQAADQFVVSGRVEHIGAGISGDSRTCSAEEIASMTLQVLDNPSYLQACQRAGAFIRQTKGPQLAVDRISAHLKGAGLWEE
jgi:MGT family glycosyltransferase